jgi:hypothetical protein
MTEARRLWWFFVGALIGGVLVVGSARAASTPVPVMGPGQNAVYLYCASSTSPATTDTTSLGSCSASGWLPSQTYNCRASATGTFTVPAVIVNGDFTATNYCNNGGDSYFGCTAHTSPPGAGCAQFGSIEYRACRYGSSLSWAQVTATSSACPSDPTTPPADPCSAKKGQEQSEGYYALGTSPTAAFAHVTCSSSCEVIFSGECPAATSLISGVVNYYCQGSMSYDGSSCSGGTATPSPATPPSDSCPSGQHVDDGPPKSCQPNTDPPCPNSWEHKVSGVCTPDACPSGYTRDDSTGVCNATPCPSGQHHDATTGACVPGDPPGGPGSPDPGDPKPPDQPPDPTFCEKNPTDPSCAKDSFSSSCNVSHATSNCQGDPVQCAQAEAATQIACDYEPTAAGWTDLRSTIGNAYTPSTYKEANTWSYDIGTALDFSDKDSGAACPSDVTFSAMGHSFTLPMTPFCTLAGYVKFFLIFAATVVALRLAFGGA